VQVPRGADLGKLRTTTLTWSLSSKERWANVYDERAAQARPLSSQIGSGDRLRVCREGDEGSTVVLDRQPWSQSAAVVLENATGRVIALTGGSDVTLEGFVRSTQARRQPGSSFKPYVYASAFAAGHTQLDRIMDGPLYLPAGNGKVWSPKNYGGGFSGPLPIRRALAASLNTVAVRLALEVGPTEIARTARSLGVRTPLRTDLTIALGSSEVTPMDQAMGYSSLARMGVAIEPVYLDVLEDSEGRRVGGRGESLRKSDGTEVVLPGRPLARALPSGVAYEMVDALREVVRAGTARRAYKDGYDRAGKTGTTNDCVDAWFVGTTPLYTVAVWIGTDGVGSLGDRETGGKAALPAWIAIMDALPDQKGLMFPVPDDAVRVPTELGVLGFVRGQVPRDVLQVPHVDGGPLPMIPR
ncbi:MAG: hypothetical protein KC621_13335, partial [Myxococcales bacterium]|nr:hypothetical protein [Myxococcales bacterium]